MEKDRKQIEEAVKLLKDNEFGEWSGNKADAERVLLSLASRYLAGELIEKVDPRTLDGHCGGCGADVAHGVKCICKVGRKEDKFPYCAKCGSANIVGGFDD